jgi:hypothetical protein
MLRPASILLLYLQLIEGQQPRYYTGNGGFTDSCPFDVCTRCEPGFFKQSCSGTNPGTCERCNGLPDNAVWITDGGFSDACTFNCKPAYTPVGNTCVARADSVFVVSVAISLPLSSAEATAQKDKIVSSFAFLGSCGICGSSNVNPILCERCRISLTIEQTAARRLLAPTSKVSVSIEQLTGSTQATVTSSVLTVTNINSMLTVNSLPSCVVVTEAAVQVLPPPPTPSAGPAATTVRPTTSKTQTTSRSSTTVPVTTANVAPPPTTAPAPPITNSSRRDGVPAPPVSPVPESSDSGTNIGMIVGISVGVIVVVIVVASIFLCCHVTRPRQPGYGLVPVHAAEITPPKQPQAQAPAAALAPATAARSEYRNTRTVRMMRLETLSDIRVPTHSMLATAVQYNMHQPPAHGVFRPPMGHAHHH